MNTVIEVIKSNKKAIIKKALIIGGTILGLAIVMRVVNTKGDTLEDADLEDQTTEEVNENVNSEE